MFSVCSFCKIHSTNISLCRYDYLKITNEKKQSFGVYCGEKTGQTVNVTGDYAVITFHSDYSEQRRGFRILFNTTGK